MTLKYAHLDKINVVKGEKVNKGQVIALVGNSGKVSTPQLHFEIRDKNGPLNPFPRIASNLATLFSKASKAALSWQKPLPNKKITKITRTANILKMYKQGDKCCNRLYFRKEV